MKIIHIHVKFLPCLTFFFAAKMSVALSAQIHIQKETLKSTLNMYILDLTKSTISFLFWPVIESSIHL